MKKETRRALITAAAAAVAIPLWMCAPNAASKRQRAPFMGVNFAHRGLHTRDRSVPENSLRAFELAAAAGYGIELDVQLSSDGQVVVFHDSTLDRVCGVHARVDEKTYEELSQISLCGTEQTVPLFSDVLNTVAGRGPLIVELKDGKHNRELCEKTYGLLAEYRGDVCVESFNPFMAAWFRFHAPELLRGQLAAPYDPTEKGNTLPKPLALAMGKCLANFVSRPHFIAYKIGKKPLTVRLAYLMGAIKVAWTSHEAKNEKNNDALIFEFYRPEKKFR